MKFLAALVLVAVALTSTAPAASATQPPRAAAARAGCTCAASGGVSRSGTTTYAYDALDRVATRGSQAFTYAGAEIDPVGRGTHARDPVGELISWTDGTTAALVGRNRHGDLAWLASGAGALTDSRIYDPYGAVAGAAGTAAPGLGFQADYTDPASAMVWMGARWYDPATAGFASRDSVFGQLRTPFTLNRYTYAQGDPLEFFDPDGRFGWSSITSFVGSVVSTVGSVVSTVARATYNYVVRPVVRTVSSAARAVSSTVATVARTARRASTVAIQRISTTTKAFATTLVSEAKDTAQAISSAAGKLKRGLAAAGSAVGRCFNGLQATCTQIALDVAVGAAVGALCINTAGLGCAIAAGAAGGAVTGAAACAAGENLGRCALQGALLGGASGGLVSKAFPALRATRAGQWFSRKVSGAGDSLRGGLRRFATEESGSIRFGGPRAADDFVDLTTPARRTHILQGDATGGGHQWPGQAGKTPFPQGWSDDRILHEISDIATDPNAISLPGRNGATIVRGTRGGVDIEVVIGRNGEIVTGYSTNLPRNPG